MNYAYFLLSTPFPSRPVPSNLNYGHVYHYLLEIVVLIGEEGKVEDTALAHMTSKPLTKGEQYVKSGAVTSMMDATQGLLQKSRSGCINEK